MQIILILIAGMAIGALIAYLVLRERVGTLQTTLATERTAHDYERLSWTQREQTIKDENQQRLDALRQESADNRQRDMQALRDNMDTQMRLLQQQTANIANTLLRNHTVELTAENRRQLDDMLSPLRADIDQFKASLAQSREAAVRDHASIESTIKVMMEQTTALGRQADRLSNALQRQNRTTGDWGELILRELLESQGLERGVHFDEQVVLKDQQGAAIVNDDTSRTMKPDVILHLADNRDVIIDSKMSLKPFIEYQSAQSVEQRTAALGALIHSIEEHYKGLARKKYHQYIAKPRVCADFVIMFVPIDGALQLVLNNRPGLWRDAFDSRVMIVGAQTLVAALRIIEMTWVNVKQERNTIKVMDEARKLIDRVNRFYDDYQKIGKNLKTATEAYESGLNRILYDRQSIMASGRALEGLGARGNKPLPGSADNN